MGFWPASFHFSYKLKLLMLITLCILLIGWATSTYLVDILHEIPAAKGMVKSFRKPTTNKEEQKENSKAILTEKLPTAIPPCPSLSPYLRGPSKLTFRASLTLEELQKENPSVAKGRHRPKDCTAQQRAGNAKFNRAKLLNVGYLEALKEENWDCFIFHDVDLVPENDFNIYVCGSQPKHLVVGRNSTGYRLRYQGYFGGVTALTREQFLKVNGFSNNYWGWGGEDDDLRIRVEIQKMKIIRPYPSIAKYTMIFHTRDQGNEANGQRMNLLRQVSQVWKTDGLNSCSYKLLSKEYNLLYTNITVDFGRQTKFT
ncbi:hypothetical protein E2320_005350 [Naja naja]|nr:hypothetical protein E2320_005350 [Naja naja]